jgi:ABC-type sugar transport system ATPase subunit
MTQELFKICEVDKSYDGVHAVRGAELTLFPGEAHALMGENGAGKSTLSKIIAGSVRPDHSRMLLDGKPVTIDGPLDAQRLGISIIYQELDLFPHLTVAENLAIGNQRFAERGWVQFKDLDRFAQRFLNQVGLSCSPRRLLASLNIGDMQLVAIARALSMNARIILMDEPTSSLFNDSVARLFRLIDQLKRQGVAIVYVSHKMDEIFRICDRVTVMRDGSTIGTRHISEITPPELIRMMVGREWQPRDRPDRTESGEVLLSVSNLTTHKLRDVSFELRRGEVLGAAGLVGAGRTELGAALMGLDPWKKGHMTLRGEPVKPGSVREASELGIRLLPEDRKLDGLMMQMSVLENSTIADLARMSPYGFVSRARERSASNPLFRELSLKAASWDIRVGALSGGNQQKVLFARCLLGDPDVLFLDDPTRGIDVGAKEDIYAIIERLAEQGKAVILVSSELPELLRCCDRILVMREGEITADLSALGVTQEEIMAFATAPVTTPGGVV